MGRAAQRAEAKDALIYRGRNRGPLPMPPKKSVEELDAELAQLEAELAALESGQAPPPKKAKKPKQAEPPPEAPEAEAPAEPEAKKPRFGLKLPRRAAPEAAAEAPAEPEAKKPRFGFKLSRREAEEAPEPAPEPAPAEAPAPPPAPEAPGLAWQGKAGAWRATPPGPQKVELVRRRLDEAGRTVEEEQIGEETIQPAEPLPPEPAPAPRRFGLFGTRAAEEAPPAAEGEAPPGEPARKRRGLLLIPVVLILALLVVAVALPLAGTDPLGTGRMLGLGGAGGPAPDAAFALSANTVAVGAPVRFEAPCRTGAGCPEYTWDFGDGTSLQGATAAHTYRTRGDFTVTLTARDANGRAGTHTETIAVRAPPAARIAATLGGSPLGGENSPVAGDSEVAFSGAGSTAEGTIAYEWSFGDGARATGAEATHVFAQPGSYRVTLVVADANGLRGNATTAVYVGARTIATGEAPASLQAAQAVNATVAVAADGGALPYAPLRLRATLTFNATQPPGGLPLPGGIPGDSLTVTIYDAAGAIVAASAGGASPQEVVVADFGGAALGEWTVEVARPQGGAQPLPYRLEVELLNGPGA